jgi:hypothetical protein
MSLVSEHRVSRRYFAMASAALVLALAALLVLTTRAQAVETIYWDNYSADPDNVAFADITGSGGGLLNLTGAAISSPEGMAYDTVTNRLFVANSEGPTGQLTFINLDGSGAGVFSAPGAVFNEPEGVAVDPVTRTIYWLNTGDADTIGWAKLDGSAGGLLNTAGTTLDGGYRLALDPVAGRVYVINSAPTGITISYVSVNGSGGGNLNTAGASPTTNSSGLAVDPAAGRLYYLNDDAEGVSYANLNGSGGGNVNIAGSTFNGPYGLALDPGLGRLYWANYNNGELKTNAIGFANSGGGGGGGISPVSAVVDGPQDPLVIKSPSGTGAPTIARSTKTRSELTCSQGSWAADYAGSFVYQAPRTYAYQWALNGAAIAGATAPTLAAAKPGSYSCAVTATNQLGSANQSSAPINVKAAKVKLTTKKKAKAKPGGVATFKVKGVNQGDLKSKNAKVCVKVPNKAKADLKAKPKCKALGKVKGGGKDSAKLRIKVGENAAGTYAVTFQVKGSPGKAAKAKIVVG